MRETSPTDTDKMRLVLVFFLSNIQMLILTLDWQITEMALDIKYLHTYDPPVTHGDIRGVSRGPAIDILRLDM